ncbi:MAG: EAL domain-containing protein [Burkholderiales bacterium]|nr:EAL domain-containing protein [Burkholderiales bacterium]
MILRTLQRRIVAVFVGLLVVVMALIVGLVTQRNQRIVADETARELEAGTHVFQRLIEQNQRQLETSATVLSGDFAFRAAIATQDRATVHSVIRNHGLRIGAQAMMVIHPEGTLIADTQQPARQDQAFPFADLLASAQSAGKSSGFRQMRDGKLYQIVLVPILAPRLIAWVAMGFEVDDRWAHDLSDATGLTVSVVHQEADGVVGLLASSLDAQQRPVLEQALRDVARGTPTQVLTLGAEHYQARQLALGGDVAVVLLRSLEQAQAPFQSLQRVLLLVVLGGVVLFVLGSVLLARGIGRPVNALAASARRIEAGDYSQPVPSLPLDEIGQLALSFDHMRERIASREEKITRLAYEDSLTGLANRTRFLEALVERLGSGSGAVVLLNIDRFASINNALGSAVGDRLLIEIGNLLSRLTPTPTLVSRLWGDEFAFLLCGADQAQAQTFAQTLLATLSHPITLEGQRLDVDGSLGIALYPQDGVDAVVLLRGADHAMLAAKRRRLGYGFASNNAAQPVYEQLSLVGEMREALTRNEFVLYYQPKLDLAEQRVTGAEALLRWQHPVRGLVSPAHFVPFAEQTGFIREITPWLLERVVEQAARWCAQDLDMVVSANLSALDILHPNLVAHVRSLLAQHRLAPQRLCLEITESALMDEPELALAHLTELSALGVKLSIDDYGSGQASLGYVKTLPVDELKIDQTFVTGVAQSPKNAAIVRSTILLSHELGLVVTAEGAETASDLSWLTDAGCDVAQGHGIARPMPADALPGWIAAYASQHTCAHGAL